jgi:hypothetical protein
MAAATTELWPTMSNAMAAQWRVMSPKTRNAPQETQERMHQGQVFRPSHAVSSDAKVRFCYLKHTVSLS